MNWITRWLRRAAKPDLPPHERWPEILHWQEGDEFETRGWPYYRIRLISLNDHGGAYCSGCEKFMGKASAKERMPTTT